MTKPPTITAITANTSRKVVKKLELVLDVVLVLLGDLVAGEDLEVLVGRQRRPAGRSASCSWLTPSSATTEMLSNLPGSASSSWAVGRSKRATVAPAGLSAVPKRAMPAIVNSCGACWLRTVDGVARPRSRCRRPCPGP